MVENTIQLKSGDTDRFDGPQQPKHHHGNDLQTVRERVFFKVAHADVDDEMINMVEEKKPTLNIGDSITNFQIDAKIEALRDVMATLQNRILELEKVKASADEARSTPRWK